MTKAEQNARWVADRQANLDRQREREHADVERMAIVLATLDVIWPTARSMATAKKWWGRTSTKDKSTYRARAKRVLRMLAEKEGTST